MKIVSLIQARLSSTRLPGKVLDYLDSHHTLLDWVYYRAKASSLCDDTYVIIPSTPNNQHLEDYCLRLNYPVLLGEEDNVLSRFYTAASSLSADIIVRITSDDPFKDSQLIDYYVTTLLDTCSDYVSNTIIPTYPEGIDIEVFTMSALSRAYKYSKLPSEQEHVTPYIWKNSHLFRCLNMVADTDLSKMRLTIDNQQDLALIRDIIELGSIDLNTPTPEIIDFIMSNEALRFRSHLGIRNSGYTKSLKLDHSHG